MHSAIPKFSESGLIGVPEKVTKCVKHREFSDETERLMDHAIRGLIGHAFDRATEILNTHRAVYEKTAQVLLQQETLKDDDIAELCAQILPADKTNRRRKCRSPRSCAIRLP